MISAVAVVIIGIVDVLFSLLDYLVNRGVPLSVVTKLLLYKIPAILVLFLPLATLFSVMIVLFRMVKDSELIIFWTSGIRYERILRPVIIFAVGVTCFSFYLGEKVVPWTNYQSNTLIQKVVLKESLPFIEENVFFKDVDNRYFYIKKVNQKNNQMEELMLYEMDSGFPQVILAKRANWNGKYWQLLDGKIHKYREDGFFDYEATFDELKLKVEYDLNSAFKKAKNTKEMSTVELKQRIAKVEKAGINAKKLKIELFLKYSFPVANFISAAIGVVLIFLFVRSSKDMWGVVKAIILALLSVFIFFFLMAFFRALSLGGSVSPFWGAWMPNVIFFVLSFFAWIMFSSKR